MKPIWFLHGVSRPYGGPWLYRLYNAERELLYVGVTRQPEPWERVKEHLWDALWGGQVTYYALEDYPMEHLALDAERAAIKAEKPLHNVRSVAA